MAVHVVAVMVAFAGAVPVTVTLNKVPVAVRVFAKL